MQHEIRRNMTHYFVSVMSERERESKNKREGEKEGKLKETGAYFT